MVVPGSETVRRQAEVKEWYDERLKAIILQTLAYQAQAETDRALHLLSEAFALAEPAGFIRLFVDEGPPMAQLLSAASARGMMPDYTGKLLAAFGNLHLPDAPPDQPLIEPLSERELEVLQLVAQGLSNREIGEQLFIALSTVKGHNRNIYGKLEVSRRTEAVARARKLGLI